MRVPFRKLLAFIARSSVSVAGSPNGRLVAGATRDYHRIKLYDEGQDRCTGAVTGTLLSGMSWASDSQALCYRDVLEEYQPISTHFDVDFP